MRSCGAGLVIFMFGTLYSTLPIRQDATYLPAASSYIGRLYCPYICSGRPLARHMYRADARAGVSAGSPAGADRSLVLTSGKPASEIY